MTFRSWMLVPLAVSIAALLWFALARWFGGNVSADAAVVAALTCWTGILAAKALGWFVGRAGGLGQQEVVVQATLGMFVRMAFPMALCAIAAIQGGPLADGGVVYAMLVVYPVSLAVETTTLLASARKPLSA